MRRDLEKCTKAELIEKIIFLEDKLKENRGRKEKLTVQDKETIKWYRLQGKTIREIADIFSVSKSLIHNITKDIKQAPR